MRVSDKGHCFLWTSEYKEDGLVSEHCGRFRHHVKKYVREVLKTLIRDPDSIPYDESRSISFIAMNTKRINF